MSRYQWSHIELNEEREELEKTATVTFVDELSNTQVVDIITLINRVLNDEISQKLFEGLSRFEVTRTSVTLCFIFSVNEQHIEDVENKIGCLELSRHRVNYVFYVFGQIHRHYPVKDEISAVFEELGDMSYLLENKTGAP